MISRLTVLLLGIVAILPILSAGCRNDRRRSARMAAALARPASKEALIRRAVRALRDNDSSAYVGLMSTVSEVTRACPDRFEDRAPGKLRAKWRRMIERSRERISHCGRIIDWKKAHQTSVTGGEVRAQLPKCEEKVIRLKDIVVTFTVEKKRFEVRLTKPYVRGDTIWGFSNGPRCRAFPSGS